jgi:hypothetical protein
MMSLSEELKERNILKLILIVRFACATLDVGHPIPVDSFLCFWFILLMFIRLESFPPDWFGSAKVFANG